MMKVDEYIELVEELNLKVWEEVYEKGPYSEEFSGNAFSFETDGNYFNVCFGPRAMFCSEDFTWIHDDELEFVPYRKQVLDHVKKGLGQVFAEIKAILSEVEIDDFEVEQEANEALKRATERLS